ncbi:alpha/beta fold hydrolase [Streptomyces sp. SID4919]|uniref:alpha/beta fold hydrolase n=1 Tax=unclassified Streptomyces TaxID=2593676 RepID=UPI000823B1F2|nr:MULTISPECIES: alpha/beta hydrolase [unclassified Streptomyces]MYY09342.1 alpha/beta fold hydrolase [Streptomyces sp. SID4919]SCK42895.1 Pimeloyl-ACP methyl ester carboxylesterase [Streptomyces sp. AmelKG-E11A]
MSVHDTRFATETIDGIDVFYREAGSRDRPTLVLLHGFPTSSHMYRNLIADLADEYHLVAPDHIGFGASAAPDPGSFPYGFEKLTEVTLALLDRIGVDRFALYVQDYGAPIGLGIAARHPERVTAIVTQSGNAYQEGFTPFWDVLFAHARDRAANEQAVRELLTAEATRWQYTHGVPADRLDRIAPETWTLDQALLDRPGNQEIQLQLFWDYQFNLDRYPAFQEYFRTHRPPLLAVWGRGDEIFGPAGAEAFARDLPDAEIHLLDAGHFALETHGAEIATLVRDFLRRSV